MINYCGVQTFITVEQYQLKEHKKGDVYLPLTFFKKLTTKAHEHKLCEKENDNRQIKKRANRGRKMEKVKPTEKRTSNTKSRLRIGITKWTKRPSKKKNDNKGLDKKK